jgi:hypothetical protein
LRQLLAEQANVAAIGFLYAAQQSQQRRLAAAARAFEKQGFARFQTKCRNIQ